MSNTTGGGRAKCPYFLKDTAKCITCEGVLQGTTTSTRFPTHKEKGIYQTRYCDKHNAQETCPLAKTLNDSFFQKNGRGGQQYVYAERRGSVGEWLYRSRVARGLSQGELAKLAFVSKSHISDIEHGRTKPSLDTLELLSEALGVTFVVGGGKKEEKK